MSNKHFSHKIHDETHIDLLIGQTIKKIIFDNNNSEDSLVIETDNYCITITGGETSAGDVVNVEFYKIK